MVLIGLMILTMTVRSYYDNMLYSVIKLLLATFGGYY